MVVCFPAGRTTSNSLYATPRQCTAFVQTSQRGEAFLSGGALWMMGFCLRPFGFLLNVVPWELGEFFVGKIDMSTP